MVSIYEEMDFDVIDRIFLFLGPACNLRCRHCQQTPLHKFNFDNIKFNEKILPVFEHFLQYHLHHKYRFAGNNKESVLKRPFYISFWGGEPLLYWNFIKKAVVYLTEKLKLLDINNGSEYYFFITTNGALLTDEMVDFLNKYHVKVHLSYDAPYPFSARDYISDTVCEKVKKIKGYGIASCYSAYNCDYLLMQRCLKRKFPDGEVKIHHRLSRNNPEMPKDIYAFDWNKIKLAIKRLVIGAKCGDPFCVQWVQKRYLYYVMYPKQYRNVVKRKSLYMDLQGNFIFHKNLPNIVVGNINDSLKQILDNHYKIREKRLSPACQFCRHRDICTQSQNWSDMKSKNGMFISCEDYYLPFYDIVKSHLKMLQYPLTKEEFLWFKQQEALIEEDIKMFLNESTRFPLEHTPIPKKLRR